MAIAFGRLEFVKRSQGKNAVCKAAYLERTALTFEGTKFQASEVFSWAHLEKPIFSRVYLPEHVDKRFQDVTRLWNEVENFENRKDSQVGFDIVLALPDDKTIALDDKICLIEKFIQTYFLNKNYGVHAVIHPPDKKNSRVSEETGKLEEVDHNWHAHLFITPRTFNDDGKTFSKKKLLDLLPNLRGATHFTIDAIKWGKVWAQVQNDYFEEKGLNLRVDYEGILSQTHLGPMRMRGKTLYADLEREEKKISDNKMLSKNSTLVLDQLTKTNSIFTVNDVENYFRKHLHDHDIESVREDFWKNPNIVQLFKKDESKNVDTDLQKFTTISIIDEEKTIMRLANRINDRFAFKCKGSKAIEKFKGNLNGEQKKAFDFVISGRGLSCIEGHAGTGKSYLLVAIKNFYESNGFTVRAFGPDNATVRVLEEKGFRNTLNTHRFLFRNHFSKTDVFSKNEVWIVDESGKLGNAPLLELLKQAEKSGAQLILSGNSAQLASVERGGMFRQFCEKFGCTFLYDVQRQNSNYQRKISVNLALGRFNEAINMISSTGGFIWSENKENSIFTLVEKWMVDRSHHPYSSQLIIAHSNEEVRQLNEVAHLYRKSCGELGEKEFKCETIFGNISVSEGDVIEFRKKNTSLGLTNGLIAVLVKASESKFVLKTQGEEKEREITFDPRKYTSFQLGYATTNFRSQGQTIDRAYVLYSRYMNRPLFYVGLTRHVRKAHCFVPRTEAKCLSDIKFQANRYEKKESLIDFTTVQEMELEKQAKENSSKIETLSKSDQILDRIKGGYLKAWASAKSHFFGYVEKIQDRQDSKAFYNVNLVAEKTPQGNVIEVKKLEPVNNQIITKIAEEKGANKSTSVLMDEKPLSQKSTHIKLPESQQILLRSYYEKTDEASILYSLVKSESGNSNVQESQTASFSKWQNACVERNKAANVLCHSILPGTLKEIFSEKPLMILQDRNDRYEKHIAPKINIADKLKDNLESLLHSLFPEGPSGKNSNGLRFGSKGSLSVICKGQKLGCFFDFESQKGGGILQLIETKLGLGETEVKAWANDFLNNPKANIPRQYSAGISSKSEDSSWISSLPPKDHPIPHLREISKYLSDKYDLLAKHPYYDEAGNLVQYNLRLQEKGNPKNKTILPLSYGCFSETEGYSKWAFKKYRFKTGKNPIYNSKLLRESPEKPILIVEGEKSADAGSVLFDHVVTISWFGGAGSAKKVDWSPLFGREVIIWPDNDAAGFKAAEEIGGCLRQLGVKSLNIVNKEILSKGFPEKWDIADSIPEGKNLTYLKDCLQRAEPNAVSITRLTSLLNIENIKANGQIDVKRWNEILWRVDERLRSSLEKEYKSKPWEVETRILAEVADILKGKESLTPIAKNLSGHKEMMESIIFQGILHQARTGASPSLDQLEEAKKTLINCKKDLDLHFKMDEKSYHYALDKTCAKMIESSQMDRIRLNEYFNESLAETIPLEKVQNNRVLSLKTPAKEK